MQQSLLQITFVLIITVVFAGCFSKPKIETEHLGEKSKLSAEAFEKLDYNVKEFGESLPGDWHREQFQTVWQRTYFVKGKTPVKEQAQTFPRFWVREEVYETAKSAAKRLERIQDKPPNLTIEQQEYWIVEGFRHQKNVYFIQTDSVLISYYMEDFAVKLAAEIKK